MSRDINSDQVNVTQCWNSVGIWGDRSCDELTTVQRCRDCKVFKQAGRQLLERPMPRGYTQHWGKLIAQANARQGNKGTAVLIFRIGSEYFGFAASQVGEVMPALTTHQIPHVQGSILQGMVTLRGELKLLVSLRQLFGIADALDQPTADAWMIRAWSRADTLVFPVSELCAMHRYQAADLKAVPATLSASMAESVAGMFDWKEHHVALLNEHSLYERLVRGLR